MKLTDAGVYVVTLEAAHMLAWKDIRDYMAAELNVMLMEQTGQARPGVDTNDIRPRLTAETPAGRAWMASTAAGTALGGGGTVFIGRSWWGFLLWVVTLMVVWRMVKRRQAEAKQPQAEQSDEL